MKRHKFLCKIDIVRVRSNEKVIGVLLVENETQHIRLKNKISLFFKGRPKMANVVYF